MHFDYALEQQLLDDAQCDDERLGDRFLVETRVYRGMNTRLKEIDEALLRLTTGHALQV